MKLRSCYTLALLVSCMSAYTVARTTEQDFEETHGTRSGSVQEVMSMDELNTIIAQNKKVVVDVYGAWCGPCKRMAPDYAKLPGAFSDILFVKIQVEQTDGSLGVRSIPTLICYIGGKKVSQESGAKSFNDLKNYVNSVFNS